MTSSSSRITALLGGASIFFLSTLGAAPASAQAENPLAALAPVIAGLATGRDDRLSDEEIRDRARDRGLEEAFAGGEVSPLGAVRGFQAYRSEQRRLERERERREQERQRQLVEGIARAFLGGAR
ncbi:MAG: hypothetical protein AAFW46_00895 [Pseudomonadota bacterium]